MRFDHASGSGLTANGTDASVVTNAAGNLVRSQAGRVVRILVVAGTSTLDVYDGTSAGGTHIYAKAAVAQGDIYTLDCPMTTGIYVAVGVGVTAVVIWA